MPEAFETALRRHVERCTWRIVDGSVSGIRNYYIIDQDPDLIQEAISGVIQSMLDLYRRQLLGIENRVWHERTWNIMFQRIEDHVDQGIEDQLDDDDEDDDDEDDDDEDDDDEGDEDEDDDEYEDDGYEDEEPTPETSESEGDVPPSDDVELDGHERPIWPELSGYAALPTSPILASVTDAVRRPANRNNRRTERASDVLAPYLRLTLDEWRRRVFVNGLIHDIKMELGWIEIQKLERLRRIQAAKKRREEAERRRREERRRQEERRRAAQMTQVEHESSRDGEADVVAMRIWFPARAFR
ncbi:hypothetical protein K490DRAFT_67409 [Saccharata proteae CBS 121410]|uniref:Uncharacterized protein n=1 Tax=Saccharata proteae CBS 121410 TaxID=1314787 RepID=A0A9P4HSM2_9PEZI|nr:hypothetical protein K490DRAFT_67409 [Saccharata proteae CBS 121410]